MLHFTRSSQLLGILSLSQTTTKLKPGTNNANSKTQNIFNLIGHLGMFMYLLSDIHEKTDSMGRL